MKVYNQKEGDRKMKQTIKTSRAAGQLEKMFRALNARYFEGKLEEPIITLQDTPRAYGHVTCGKTWTAGQTRKHELNIATGTLHRPIEETTATLMHEMVHLWNMQQGVQDCSRGNTYHNKHFRDEAIKRDLDIQKHERYGWTITAPTPALCDFIIEQGWTDFDMHSGGGLAISIGPNGKQTGGSEDGDEGERTKKPSSTRKYICPACGNSCRATKEINLICGDCMERMTLAD